MLTNSSRILNLIKPLPIFFVTKDVYYLKPWFQISAIIVAIFSFIFSAYQIHQGQYRYNQSLILESYSILSDKDSLSAAKTFAMNTIVKNNGSIDGANIGHWESINTASKVELKNTSKTRLRRMDFSHQEILWSCKDCEIKDSIGVNFTLDNHVGTKQSSSYSLLNSIFSDNEIRNSELKKIIKTYIINGFIEKVNFTDNIRNSAFIFSSIIDSKIEDLTLENNSFEGSTIRNVSFKGTSLNNVSLVGTKFESVDFTGSSWKDVNITNAEFINVKGLTCENSKGAIGTDNITGKTWCSNIITKDRASLNTKTVSIKEYLSERLNMAEKFEFENTILNINKNSVSEDFGT
ncbi:pentapeptide repeat-containing protein, partial [Vibrio splendidus]|uniref:pentapeptide repeat-containing protein n=1 Tax=Vibrio splendidus TaxID=29497 RepID=UPI00080E93CE